MPVAIMKLLFAVADGPFSFFFHSFSFQTISLRYRERDVQYEVRGLRCVCGHQLATFKRRGSTLTLVSVVEIFTIKVRREPLNIRLRSRTYERKCMLTEQRVVGEGAQREQVEKHRNTHP